MEAHTADLWKPEGDTIRCGLCPHACRIREGGLGVCGVRRNVGGSLIALTYGRVSSVAVDPIRPCRCCALALILEIRARPDLVSELLHLAR